jgi:hypothetical protein
VLQLGLARLARHYGYAAEARGAARAAVRTWLAPDVEFAMDRHEIISSESPLGKQDS